METIIDFENVREQVSFIGEAVTMYDELTKKIMEARFNYRMLALNPKRGIGFDRNTNQAVQTTPAEMAKNVEFLASERADIAKIIFEVTGTETMDEARLVYLNILSAYQRVGGLRELRRLYDLGFTKAVAEAAENENICTGEEFDAPTATAAQALFDAITSMPAFDLTQVESTLITRPGLITLK